MGECLLTADRKENDIPYRAQYYTVYTVDTELSSSASDRKENDILYRDGTDRTLLALGTADRKENDIPYRAQYYRVRS